MKKLPRILQCLLLFLNGALALALELIWCKRLEQLCGVGLFAVTETVSCFLLGIALGAWFGSKLCNSERFWDNPKRCLVRLQSGTLLACLLFSILIFSSLSYVLVEMFGSMVTQLMCALLVIPAIGLGMLLTLSIVIFSDASHEQSKMRDTMPALYTCNLFGSYAGAGLTVLYFMPAAGLWHSALIAITIGLIALCVLLGISFAFPSIARLTNSLSSISPTSFLSIKQGVLLVCVSGFVSIALEILYVRIANLLFGSGIYSLALVLILYLFSSAIGAWAAIHWRSDLRSNSFVLLFAPLIVTGYLYNELVLLNKCPEAYLQIYKWLLLAAFNNFSAHMMTRSFLLLLLVFIPISLLSAFFISVLSSVRSKNKNGSIGYLICSNNIGSVAGAWITGFVLIPFLSTIAVSGIQKSLVVLSYVLSGLSLLAVACISKATPSLNVSQAIRSQRAVCVSVTALMLVASINMVPPWSAALFSLNVPLLCQGQKSLNDLIIAGHNIELPAQLNKLDFYREGLNSTVAVFSNNQNNIRYLKIDGRSEGSIPIDWSRPSSVPTDLSTHVLLAQLPLQLASAHPLDVCLIGYGTGTTAMTACAEAQVKKLHVLELEKCVVEAARFFKYQLPVPNPSISAQVVMHFEDARSYLLSSNSTYDVIICQPSEPWTGGSSNLFSRQYWKVCRKRLAKDGVLCQWIQLYGLTPQLLADTCRTFTSVFPNTTVIHEPGAGEILLLAGNTQTEDISKLFLKARSKLSSNLHPELLLTAAQLQQWCNAAAHDTQDNRMITDDNLLIEYAMSHVEQDPEECISENMASLERYRKNI